MQEEQKQIVAEFEAISTPGTCNCAGAGVVDDILIWIHKPSLKKAKKLVLIAESSFVVESTSLV